MRLPRGLIFKYHHVRTPISDVWMWGDTTQPITTTWRSPKGVVWVPSLQYPWACCSGFRSNISFCRLFVWIGPNSILTRGYEFSKIQISLWGNRSLVPSVGRGERTFYSSWSAGHPETLWATWSSPTLYSMQGPGFFSAIITHPQSVTWLMIMVKWLLAWFSVPEVMLTSWMWRTSTPHGCVTTGDLPEWIATACRGVQTSLRLMYFGNHATCTHVDVDSPLQPLLKRRQERGQLQKSDPLQLVEILWLIGLRKK